MIITKFTRKLNRCVYTIKTASTIIIYSFPFAVKNNVSDKRIREKKILHGKRKECVC